MLKLYSLQLCHLSFLTKIHQLYIITVRAEREYLKFIMEEIMKKIYKIRDKYFYDGKVQLAMPRMKENLLISKNGIEYVEVSDNYNLIKSSSYHAPKGSSFPLSKVLSQMITI